MTQSQPGARSPPLLLLQTHQIPPTDDAARKLGSHVEAAAPRGHVPADHRGQRDGGVEVPARDVAGSVDQNHQRQAIAKGGCRVVGAAAVQRKEKHAQELGGQSGVQALVAAVQVAAVLAKLQGGAAGAVGGGWRQAAVAGSGGNSDDLFGSAKVDESIPARRDGLHFVTWATDDLGV